MRRNLKEARQAAGLTQQQVEEEVRRVRMITLVSYKGHEKESKNVLKTILEQNVGKKIEVLSFKGRKEHFHILGEGFILEGEFKEKWPGRVRCEHITEPQAEWMKGHHKLHNITLEAGHSKEDTFQLQ